MRQCHFCPPPSGLYLTHSDGRVKLATLPNRVGRVAEFDANAPVAWGLHNDARERVSGHLRACWWCASRGCCHLSLASSRGEGKREHARVCVLYLLSRQAFLWLGVSSGLVSYSPVLFCSVSEKWRDVDTLVLPLYFQWFRPDGAVDGPSSEVTRAHGKQLEPLDSGKVGTCIMLPTALAQVAGRRQYDYFPRLGIHFVLLVMNYPGLSPSVLSIFFCDGYLH